MLWGDNMIENSLKIKDTTKTKFLELIYFQSEQKYEKNTAVGIYAVCLPRWVSISVLVRDFSGIK